MCPVASLYKNHRVKALYCTITSVVVGLGHICCGLVWRTGVCQLRTVQAVVRSWLVCAACYLEFELAVKLEGFWWECAADVRSSTRRLCVWQPGRFWGPVWGLALVWTRRVDVFAGAG